MALPATELQTKTQADRVFEELRHAAHHRAIHSSTAEMAAFFQRVLGQQLTALMAGIADPKTIGRWARGENSPRGITERRLRDGYHIAILLTLAEGEDTARAWFMGMNPFLRDRSPIKAICCLPDGSDQAMDAAIAYLSYG